MDTISLIILVIICLLVGFFSNSLLRILVNEGKTLPSTRQSEGIYLSRDPESMRIIVEMNGQTVSSAFELTDSQRAILQNTIQDLRTWLGQPASVGQSPVSSAWQAADLTEPRPIQSDYTSIPSSTLPSFPQTTESAPTVRSGKPAKSILNPVNILVRAIDAERPKISQNPKSIVSQVNDILQEKIKGTPLAQRGIELTENPDHTMLVVVGLNRYEGVEVVPDEEIKALIRHCVSEWSNQTR